MIPNTQIRCHGKDSINNFLIIYELDWHKKIIQDLIENPCMVSLNLKEEVTAAQGSNSER